MNEQLSSSELLAQKLGVPLIKVLEALATGCKTDEEIIIYIEEN